MSRLKTLAAAIVTLPVFIFAAPVSAANEGQIEGGDIYRIKNVTKNVDFTDPATADACDALTYKVRVHNPGPGSLSNVNVKATLPSGEATSNTSTVTVSAVNADPASTSDTVTVNLSSSRSLSYVSGSTKLLDANNGVISTLPDGVTSGGVNIGTVDVSIDNKRFVQFDVKVSCPQPPTPTPVFSCTALDAVRIDRTHVDFTAHGSATNATISGYDFKVTKDGNVVDTNTVNTSASSAVYHFNQDTGTYVVSAVVNTDKGSTDASECSAEVTVSPKSHTVVVVKTTTPPAKLTELPNTGPEDLLKVFAGASAAGTAGHYGLSMIRRRRGL